MKMNQPQRTALSLAIATALTAMAPTVTLGQTVISTNTNATQHWSDGDFTVNAGVSLFSDAGDTAVFGDGGGVLGILTNNGTINGADGGITTTNDINRLHNNGNILGGTYYGIANFSATINVFSNDGIINGIAGGILNDGNIGSFLNESGGAISSLENTNNGTITDFINDGTISKLENSGVINSSTPSGMALTNGGTITVLENNASGTIDSVLNIGTINTLNNQGVIGSFHNQSSGIISSLENANNGTITDFINDGTISKLENSGVINSSASYGMALTNGGTTTVLENKASGTIDSVFNIGTINTLNNQGTISGLIGLINGGIVGSGTSMVSRSGHIGNLTNSGTIAGAGGSGIANYDGTISTLTNSGTISSEFSAAIYNNTGSEITTLNNTVGGVIASTWADGIFNAGLIGTVSNSGDIHGATGISNGGTIGSGTTATTYTGMIGTLTNSGTIRGTSSSGNVAGISNAFNSSIGTLNNSGTISSDIAAIVNAGTITTINNNGSGTLEGAVGIGNIGTITTLTNNGLIHGVANGIMNTSGGAIGVLNNSGTIIGDNQAAISNSSLISALNNKIGGVIQNGISNNSNGSIISLDNKGTIAGSSTSTTAYALYNEGNIGTLNNSGLITSPVDAIYLDSSSTLGILTNSGTIAGTISNFSTQDLYINGGSGSTFGLLTGSSGGKGVADIGQINNQNGNVVFGSGNQLLNDNIDVDGNIVANIGGVLQVNNQIHITGDYRQDAAATLNIGVAGGAVTNGVSSDLGYGRLIVSGNAIIDAGSSVMLKKVTSYGFANGQRYLVVQADSAGTNYNESTLRYGATGFNGTVSGSSVVDGSNLDLVLTLDGGTVNQATNSNAQSTLNGLFNYTGTDAGLMNLFNAVAAVGSTEEGNRAGSQLSPTSGKAGVAGASTAVSQQVNTIAFNRLDSGSSAPQQGGSGLSGGDGMSNNAFWGQAFGGRASADARDGVSGYHASYSGLLLGADTELNNQWRAGGLFNYASTSVSSDGDNAGSYSRVNSYGVTAYAGYTGEPWYVNMSVGAMRSDVNAHRVVNFGGFNGIANSSYNGMHYIAAAQAGYPLNFDHVLPGLVLTPLAGLTYSTLKQNGYTETGGNGAALQVGSSDTHSVKSDLGVKLERNYKTSYGLLKPTAQLLWRHEYSDTRMQSVANFAADTSGATTFVTAGAKPVANTGVLSLGLILLRNENLTLSTNYTLESGGGYTSQTGSLMARWRF
ncbi:autotransporter outer membrane beta-barrel domain-containing protein [Herminiimonas arsenitoxidans]|uniref:autotransporter outer membrane beta-barrel domain-containing protein n=1 Tax=Herminiimonas arsenitoxidans TaxID=1809410 RepID=UPI001E54CB0B|nr:autotransporter domain-containing protein [Herminiimonas arsenitoxidans]